MASLILWPVPTVCPYVLNVKRIVSHSLSVTDLTPIYKNWFSLWWHNRLASCISFSFPFCRLTLLPDRQPFWMYYESPCRAICWGLCARLCVPGRIPPHPTNHLSQLSAFASQQAPHCHRLPHSPPHLPCVNRGFFFFFKLPLAEASSLGMNLTSHSSLSVLLLVIMYVLCARTSNLTKCKEDAAMPHTEQFPKWGVLDGLFWQKESCSLT